MPVPEIRPSISYAPFVPPALSRSHVEALRRDGVCIVDNVMPAVQVRALRAALMHRGGGDGSDFRRTMQPREIRSDRVLWVHEHEDKEERVVERLERASAETEAAEQETSSSRAIAAAVCALKGIGSHFEEALGHALDAPSRCMAALYAPPVDQCEPSGYRPHLDHRPPDDEDLYWCWKSSREQSERALTSILYLNEDWCDQDGGQLRMFLGCTNKDDPEATAMNIQDVTPVGGRLVVFKSREIPHAVMPVTGNKTRMAISCWHLLNSQEES